MTQGTGTMNVRRGKSPNDLLPLIGIIGVGFVGSAIKQNAEMCRVVALDTDPSKGFNATYDELKECEGIFVCVPSPPDKDGSCDTSILESVLSNLKGYTGVIISKVTATPDVYERLQLQFPNLVHVPEFLTAAKATSDYANQTHVIIGGNVIAYLNEAKRIIKYTKPKSDSIDFQYCGIGEAALIKYIANTFLATKVIFMNEMSAIAKSKNYDWLDICAILRRDDRIGDTHLQVPGPDGYYGFGGACFPKDTSALIKYAEKLKINVSVLKAAVKKNTLLRLTNKSN